MIYNDIQKLLIEEDYEGILEYLTPDFLEINDQSERFLNVGQYSDPNGIREALAKSNSLFGRLKEASTIIDTLKKEKELIKYAEIKSNWEDGRFVSATADKEASQFVQNERRIRNIIDAYISKTDKNISVCQTLLKYLTEEIKLNRGN